MSQRSTRKRHGTVKPNHAISFMFFDPKLQKTRQQQNNDYFTGAIVREVRIKRTQASGLPDNYHAKLAQSSIYTESINWSCDKSSKASQAHADSTRRRKGSTPLPKGNPRGARRRKTPRRRTRPQNPSPHRNTLHALTTCKRYAWAGTNSLRHTCVYIYIYTQYTYVYTNVYS